MADFTMKGYNDGPRHCFYNCDGTVYPTRNANIGECDICGSKVKWSSYKRGIEEITPVGIKYIDNDYIVNNKMITRAYVCKLEKKFVFPELYFDFFECSTLMKPLEETIELFENLLSDTGYLRLKGVDEKVDYYHTLEIPDSKKILVKLKDGEPKAFRARGLKTDGTVAGTYEGVDFFNKWLIKNQRNEILIDELVHSRNPENKKEYGCVYLFIDSKKIMVLKGSFAKGYGGTGARGALQVDVIADLLDIPHCVHDATGWSSKRIYELSEKRRPNLNISLKDIKAAKQRIKKYGFKIDITDELDNLQGEIPVEELIEKVRIF